MKLIFPILALFLAVLVAAIPWGLPGETTFILPFITLLLVFLFSAGPEEPVPAWLVFFAGLATDVLTAGPVGYWAMIYTLTYTLARQFARGSSVSSVPGMWLSFAVTAVIAGISAWGIASLYYFRLIDWEPIALGTGVAVFVFPFTAWLLRHPVYRRRKHKPSEWQIPVVDIK